MLLLENNDEYSVKLCTAGEGVFDCNRFDDYIYRKDVVHVESDPKPLQYIFIRKPLFYAHLHLQNKYKPGKSLHIAD